MPLPKISTPTYELELPSTSTPTPPQKLELNSNDHLNIGNPKLDQFGVQLPGGTRDELGISGAIISA